MTETQVATVAVHTLAVGQEQCGSNEAEQQQWQWTRSEIAVDVLVLHLGSE